MTFFIKLTNNYGFELTVLDRIRKAEDGVSFIEFKVNWDRYLSDHSPSFQAYILLINYIVFEVNIYYLHHR